MQVRHPFRHRSLLVIMACFSAGFSVFSHANAQAQSDQPSQADGSVDSEGAVGELDEDDLPSEDLKPHPCPESGGSGNLQTMATVLRNQFLMTGFMPSDLLLRCNKRTVDVGLRQDTYDDKIKASSFTVESSSEVRTMEAAVMSGGISSRYGLLLEKIVAESTWRQDLTGTSSSSIGTPETLASDTTALRLEAAMRFGNLSAGFFVRHLSEKRKKKVSVGGSSVSTSNDRLAVTQPGLSVDWTFGELHVLAARNQSVEDVKKVDRLRLPWTNVLRVIRILEQDQGIRAQIERSGSLDNDGTAFNKGLLAYFLTIDNATVDVAWFGRSASYNSTDTATADQLASFGFAASGVWHFAAQADVYASMHSLSANDSLGGTDKKTAHRLVTGGNLGLQVVF